MNIKIIAIIVIVSGAAGYLICSRYCNHETEKIVTRDRIVTEIHTITHPDGSSETDTKIIEDKKRQEEMNKSVMAQQSQWRINGGISVNTLHLSEITPAYEIGVDRRILGPIWLGVRGNTRGEAALQLGIEF